MKITCDKCGGFIGEPGKAYGYAGRWCQCHITEELKVAQPRSLEDRIAELEEQVRRLQERTTGLIRYGL